MKAILEFNLPEEDYEYRAAVDGSKWKSAAWNFNQWIAGQVKYSLGNTNEDRINALEECQRAFLDSVNDDQLSLD